MLLKSTLPILKFFFNFFLFAICAIIIISLPFIISCLFWRFYFYIKGIRKKQATYKNTTLKHNFLKVLFFDFPRRFVLDRLLRDPDEFDQYGLWCFVGQQGSGKTIALIDMLHRIKSRFPACKILSNTPCLLADQIIEGPEDFVFNDNGKSGMVVVLDEAQNWFNSQESRNFPPECLQEICQERKQYKMLAMTTQRLNRLSAALREQVDYYVKPFTIAGCLTFVRVYRPQMKEFEAEIKKLRKIKTYFFVHSDELRESFNTRAKIARLSLKGWKPRNEQITAEPIDIAVDSKIKIKRQRPDR